MIGPCLGLLKILILVPFYFVKIRFVNDYPEPTTVKNVGLFHIPCHANGGGEKVLWAIVNKLVEEKKYNIHIYSDTIKDKEVMISKVNKFFGYNLSTKDFNLIELPEGYLTYSEHWTIFSRYLEGLSHALVAFRALDVFMPDIFVETFTAHFSPITVKLLNPNLKVMTYVHYPFTGPHVIEGYWNDALNSKQGWKARIFSGIKYFYHAGLYYLYKAMGFFSDVCFTNSSWTQKHMEANWGDRCEVLYPPCNVDEFLNKDFNSKEKVVVSLGQYRPEKRHDLQLDMMKYHLKKHPESDIKFKILGSGKFEESELAFQRLQKRVKDEGIKNVELLKDLPFETLKNTIRSATFGVHTMIDEHFGISIVELLSGGLVTLAHNSAGPKDDILGNGTHALYGLLAKNDTDFMEKFDQMLTEYYADANKRKAYQEMIVKGQKFATDNLSNEAFATKFVNRLKVLASQTETDAKARVKAIADAKAKAEAEKKKQQKKEGDL